MQTQQYPQKPIGSKTTILITILLYVLLTLLGAKGEGQWDQYYWKIWAVNIFNNGLTNTYAIDINDYMPFFQYILYIYVKITASVALIEENIGFLKAFALAFDFLGIWYVYKFLNKNTAFIALLLINMLNIGFNYNSLIWAQYDSIYATLNFIAVYYGFKRKTMLSAMFFVMAFNMKVQSVVLLPVIGYFYLDHILVKKDWRSVVMPLLGMVVVQLFFLAPFFAAPGGIMSVVKVITNSVGRYPNVSLNACNIWHLIIWRENLMNFPDNQILFAGLTYKTIGLVMFFTASFVTLFPVLKNLVLRFRGKEPLILSPEKLMLICGLLYLCFYYFNTQMHERYYHPAMIFVVAYAFYKKKYVVYVLFSVASFLTLERVMQWLDISYHTFIFSPVFIAVINTIIIAYMFYLLYRKPKAVNMPPAG